MKKLLLLMACVGLVFSTSGCSSTSCGGSGFSCFKNRPVRTRLQSWFGGAPCDTCCPPAGQPANFGTNVAPLCDSCAVGGNAPTDVQLYDETGLNGPMTNQIIQNPSPIPENSIPNGIVQPPSSMIQ